MAINIENDSGEYESSTTIPNSEYVLSDDSYCNVNGEKDTSIKISYENGLIGISDITKKVKCFLYFDKPKVINTIIGDTTRIEEKTTFTGIATEDDTGIFKAPDDYGTSYYFRGIENQLNNWVKFAGFYWRIIRINGNGTVRMIYSGKANGEILNSNKYGINTQISGIYNHTYNDNAYVGYMMGIPLNGTTQTANQTSNHSTSYGQAHTNTYDSDAKKTIDSWYKINIEDKNLSSYIDKNTGFCNDRNIDNNVGNAYKGEGYGIQYTAYASFGRLYQNDLWKTTQTPTLQCTNKSRDLFTHTSSRIGNKKLKYSVGMITSDEVIFAGGFGGKENGTFYLYTKSNYWTMSPGRSDTVTNNFYVSENSAVVPDSNLRTDNVANSFVNGFRPILNLRANTKMTGSGSESDPFVVV